MSYWKVCSSCKKEIPFHSKYFECSVSTCTGPRTGYVFCSFNCFERHLPGARHRDAGAIEKISPQNQSHESAKISSDPTIPSPQRRIISNQSPISPTSDSHKILAKTNEDDILIVVSKLKSFIKRCP